MARRKPPETRPAGPAEGLHATLEETLLKAMTRAGSRPDRMDATLRRLEKVHGEGVYTALLRLLSRLEFSPSQARRHWRAIVAHTEVLGRSLRRPVDFRVALADYFVSMSRKIRHPMVLEILLFKKAEEESLLDGLTGLYNFRYLKNLLPRQVAHARRAGQMLSLVFFDLDDFKAYNDRFGHEAGNELLRRVGGVMGAAVREMDVVCRYGGEEFLLLLPGSDKFGALAVAERVRAALEQLQVPAARPGRCVTLSGGVACFPVDAERPEDLLAAADSAMYHAKSVGKNRVELYSKERRAWERRREVFEGRCTLHRMSFPLKGENLAHGGFYLVSSYPVDHNSSVALDLDLPAEEGAGCRIHCRARVTRCEPLTPSGYGLGVALTHMSAADRRRYEAALAACGLA